MAVAATLFVAAIPAALILTVVRLMVFDPDYYRNGYERHDVAAATGMSRTELDEATTQIQAYFRGGPPVSLVVQKEWGREPLYNAREQQHLADVRDVLNLAFRAQEASLVYLVVAGGALLAFRRPSGRRSLASWAAAGAGLTLALFVVVGLLALSDFNWLWTRLHMIWFSNDLWMLDPRTDYLIRLYPVAFWFGAVIDVVVRSAFAAFAALLVSWGYLWSLAVSPGRSGLTST